MVFHPEIRCRRTVGSVILYEVSVLSRGSRKFVLAKILYKLQIKLFIAKHEGLMPKYRNCENEILDERNRDNRSPNEVCRKNSRGQANHRICYIEFLQPKLAT